MDPTRTRRWQVLAAFFGMTLMIGACTASDASPGANGSTQIDVTLQEWAVVIDQDSAPAGEVTFDITNDGPADVHEFVILKTDLAPGDLPVDDRGVVDESGGLEVIDEVEDIEVGGTAELSVTLESGSYVLVCNIYDEGEAEAHYALGMRVAFTVP